MSNKIPSELDAIAKTVLSYKPPEKEKAAKQREKRKKRAKKK